MDRPPHPSQNVSAPPTPPRLRSTGLPELGNEDPAAIIAPVITEDTDISTLPPHQLYELNQDLLSDSVPTRPLIDAVVPMSTLRAEYENGSASFLAQIDYLQKQGFRSVRRARGDGDCFYRSVAFAYVEQILDSPDVGLGVASSLSTLESTLPMLEKAGFQKMVFEDFYDCFVSMVEQIIQPGPEGKRLDPEILQERFQSPEVSNSVVVYLRLLTSAQIRTDPDTYAPFLFDPELGEPMEPRQFCESFVEAMGKEADHVQITALSSALKTDISIAYLDGRSADGKVDFVDFSNANGSGTEPVMLLYRPGHYDILVKGNGIHVMG